MNPTSSFSSDLMEEYSRALHTKSYTDLYSKVHRKSPSKNLDEIDEKLHHQESVIASVSSGNVLLLDFFDTTLEASTACASLLSSVNLARTHHCSIRRLLLILSASPSSALLLSQLSSLLDLKNPLSREELSCFHLVHSRYPSLIHRLTSSRRKISRRVKLMRFAKKFVLCGGRGWEVRKKTVDAAAKGAYIVGRELDTVSRVVRRVEDEVEHGRDVAKMVVRSGERDMARVAVREFGEGRLRFGLEEQLEELEEHVYLCLIDIDRSRRMVVEGMMEELH